jgi:hypothetical protein
MPNPNPRTMGGPLSSSARALTGTERSHASHSPAHHQGEGVDASGRPAADTDVSRSRSPGCFAVTLSGDRKTLWIGEDWIGPGVTEAEGGLEGCSEDSPGFVFLADGRMMPVGGKTAKTAASLYAEATATGRTLVLALVPEPDSGHTGIVYYGVHVSGTISATLGTWIDVNTYLPAGTYDDYYALPIAIVELELSDSYYRIADVHWNLESAAVTVGGGGTTTTAHPWRLSVSGDTFSVSGGRVNIGPAAGSNLIVVADSGPFNISGVTKYVWLNVTHYNTGIANSVATINYGAAFPNSSYAVDTIPSNGSALPAISGYCTHILPIGIVTDAGIITQYLREDQFVPYGTTWTRQMTVGYRDLTTSIEAVVSTITTICGIQQGPGTISYVTLIESQANCPTP